MGRGRPPGLQSKRKTKKIIKRVPGKVAKKWKLKIKAPKAANRNKKQNMTEATALLSFPSAVKLVVNDEFIEYYGLSNNKTSEVKASTAVMGPPPVLRLTPLTIPLKRVDIDGDQPGGRCLSPDITEIVKRRVVKISLSRLGLGLSNSKRSVVVKKKTATTSSVFSAQKQRNTRNRNSGGTGFEIPDLPFEEATPITKLKSRAPRGRKVKLINSSQSSESDLKIYEIENDCPVPSPGVLPTRYTGTTKEFKIILKPLDLNPMLIKQLEKSLMKMNTEKCISAAKKTFKCDSCPDEFSSKEALLTHQSSHSSSTSKTRTFPCESCPETFQYASSLLTHMLLHSEEMKYKCGNCGQRFQHAINFNAHTLSRRCSTKN